VAFIGNQATGSGQGGGGMFNNGANPVLNGVTFSGNTTPGSGGGIFNNNGSNASLTNVTISGNTGSTQGGGIANVLSNPSLNNVTVSGNVGGDGSGMYSEDSTPAVYNSIFWGDNAESPELVNAAPNFTTIVTLVDSVVQGAVSSSGDCFNDTHTACTHVLNTNPRLGALRANGGFTKTLALGSGSSAVNTGGLNVLCAPRDQRGVKRPQGPRCDMGAYEKK
jgi:hypothetical protein